MCCKTLIIEYSQKKENKSRNSAVNVEVLLMKRLVNANFNGCAGTQRSTPEPKELETLNNYGAVQISDIT